MNARRRSHDAMSTRRAEHDAPPQELIARGTAARRQRMEADLEEIRGKAS